jgi:hypothetical protein
MLHYYDPGMSHETIEVKAPVAFYDDFLGADVVIPAAGSVESGCKWAKKIVGAAPPTVAKVADELNGVVACALTSASQKQSADLYMNDELQFSVRQGLILEARIKQSVLPTLVAESAIGLIGAWADGYDAVTYSAFFTCDGDGEIICESDDNVTNASATSGVTLTNSDWAVLKIDCTDLTDIKFYVNGAEVAGATTFSWAASAANSKVQPICGMYKASGAGVGTLQVDYIKTWQKRS